MKKRNSLSILGFAVVVMLAQACAPKSEVNNDEATSGDTATMSETMPAMDKAPEAEMTRDEKRAKMEKETAAREETRRIAFEKQAKLTPTYTDADGKIVYNKAEVDPAFEGGNKALSKYLRDNIKFPKTAEEKGIEGTVFVDFIVGTTGLVREVSITDAPGEEVDQSFRDEAIRVVSTMPKWIPGRQRGKAVQVRYSLPIAFQMI